MWEYETIVQTGGFMGHKSEELDRKKLGERLAEMGADGWELVWMLPGQNLHHEKDGHVFIFKRQA